MRTLDKEEINLAYFLELLQHIYKLYYTNKTRDMSGEMRYATCRLDVVFYRDEAKSED